MKVITSSVMASVLVVMSGCGGAENSDGSDASTYSSCTITDSAALFADDRANDVSQCWDGVDFEEQSLALDWCEQQVSNYIASEYLVGHQVEFRVASTNCLETASQASPVTGSYGEDSIDNSKNEDSNVDYVSPSTSWSYKSCRIVSSEALFQSDRDYDESQCWNGGTEQDPNLALDWCRQKVNEYIDVRYVFGHTVEYSIAPSGCGD